jgi:hypothetical protein
MKLAEEIDKVLGDKVVASHDHFVHHKPYTTLPGIDPGSQLWETGDSPPDLRYDQHTCVTKSASILCSIKLKEPEPRRPEKGT